MGVNGNVKTEMTCYRETMKNNVQKFPPFRKIKIIIKIIEKGTKTDKKSGKYII